MTNLRATLFTSLALLTACSLSEAQDAVEDELLAAAISGEEDYLGDGTARSGEGGEEGVEGEGPRDGAPPMFRECDAEGEYVGLFSAYDADGSGELEKGEREEAEGEQAGRPGGPRDHLIAMLHLVYDVDKDGELSEDERAEVLADFTERCEVIHAQVLAEFDADGSGDLDEDEQAAAHEAHMERVEAMREEMEACREEMGMEPRPEECDGEGGKPGDGGEGGPSGGGEGGPDGGGEAMGDRPPPMGGPLLAEFDTDGDGDLSDDELEALRDEVRERIRSGEVPQAACEPAE